MILLTLAGRYAGTLRDYSFVAGRAALSAGTARPPDDAAAGPRAAPATSGQAPTQGGPAKGKRQRMTAR